MNEHNFTTRTDLYNRIGAASQAESMLLDAPYGCVIIAASFTHGVSDEHLKHGLELSPTIVKVNEGAHFVAEKHNQTVTMDTLSGQDENTLAETLTPLLEAAESLWIGYFTSASGNRFIGHMIGVIKTGTNEYSRWDSPRLNKLARMTPEQLAAEIKEDMHPKLNDVFVFSFLKKQL